jgi:hypothetical protein
LSKGFKLVLAEINVKLNTIKVVRQSEESGANEKFEKFAKKGQILQTFCQNTKVKP